MGLFRPLNEGTALNELSSNTYKNARNVAAGKSVEAHTKGLDLLAQHRAAQAVKFQGGKEFAEKAEEAKSLARLNGNKNPRVNMKHRGLGSVSTKPTHYLNASAALLGISDEEFYELSEGNCNSDTCKCKGGTCPVEVTDGISTSSAAAKKLANAGHTNQSDLNAVTPNAEYNKRNDAFFIGDGDSPETSKTNIPAILAARTAGGAPHGWTTDNGINGTGPNVFKLKKLKDDDDGPNG